MLLDVQDIICALNTIEKLLKKYLPRNESNKKLNESIKCTTSLNPGERSANSTKTKVRHSLVVELKDSIRIK